MSLSIFGSNNYRQKILNLLEEIYPYIESKNNGDSTLITIINKSNLYPISYNLLNNVVKNSNSVSIKESRLKTFVTFPQLYSYEYYPLKFKIDEINKIVEDANRLKDSNNEKEVKRLIGRYNYYSFESYFFNNGGGVFKRIS